MSPSWLLLSSRLPRNPSRLRLAVWRRLRRLGAVLLHDAVWVLPAGAKAREALEWLAEEIEEQGGTALVCEAASLERGQDERLVTQFRSEADARYAAIAEAATRLGRLLGRRSARGGGAAARRTQAERQLRGLERALRLERRRDYFRASGRASAEAELAEALEQAEGSRASGEAREDAHAVGH